MISIVALAAAACLLLWPAKAPAVVNPYASVPTAAGVTYLESLQALQTVRSRLATDGKVSVDLAAAIDCLTLALVHGSSVT